LGLGFIEGFPFKREFLELFHGIYSSGDLGPFEVIPSLSDWLNAFLFFETSWEKGGL